VKRNPPEAQCIQSAGKGRTFQSPQPRPWHRKAISRANAFLQFKSGVAHEFFDGEDGVDSVSYTHLDVYKRQEKLIQSLQGRGIINSNNELCADLQPVRRKMLQEESKKQQMEKAAAFAHAEEQHKQIQQVRELLDGLADPETGEPVEIYFDNDDGNLAINIRGTEWVRLEAQRLLSTLS